MAKVKIQATAEDTARAEGTGEFVLPKPGLYHLKLTEVNPGFSKGDDGEEDKAKPRLECVYQIVGEGKDGVAPTATYGNIWDYVTFSKDSGWKRAQFMRALYPDRVTVGQDLDDEIDTDDIIERIVVARVKHEKGRTKDDPPRAKIATLFPLGDDFSAATEGAPDAFGDATDGTPDPFAGEPEPDDNGGLLTEAELMSMELKALGEIAKEFDLNPSDLIVRNSANKVDADKTQAAVVAAILEAQNGPAEPGDAPADDDPF